MNASLRELADVIKADVGRRLTLEGKPVSLRHAIGVALQPGVVCVVAFRVTSWLHARRHRVLVRIIDDLQHLYTGIELHIGAAIGGGLVLADCPGGGISDHVRIGRNCTLLGAVTITLNADGVDPTKGGITIGDHCVIGNGARILGTLTLGDGTQIKPNSVVVNSFAAPGCVVDGIPATKRGVVPLDDLTRWSPFCTRMMSYSEVP